MRKQIKGPVKINSMANVGWTNENRYAMLRI